MTSCEPERLRSLDVDDQLEFGRLHHRQVGRFLALEDAAGIVADLTKSIPNIGSVTHQSADFGNLTVAGCHGNHVARRQGSELHASGGKYESYADEQCVGPLALDRGEGLAERLPPQSPASGCRDLLLIAPRGDFIGTFWRLA